MCLVVGLPGRLGGRLQRATTSLELAVAVCESTRLDFGVAQCRVTLHDDDECPSVTVDNTASSDDERLGYLAGGWSDDALLRQLRDDPTPVFVADGTGESLLLPILGLGQLRGSIRCHHASLPVLLRRDLTTMGIYVSIRLAQLGLAEAPDPALARLTRRQRDVAVHAAAGCSNFQIGEQLQISEDTVKKHLKDIYQRLGVRRRTELAARVRPRAPPTTVPFGVSWVGTVAITRGGTGQPGD